MDTNLKEAVQSGRQVCWLFISLAKELNKGRHRETPACDLEQTWKTLSSMIKKAGKIHVLARE